MVTVWILGVDSWCGFLVYTLSKVGDVDTVEVGSVLVAGSNFYGINVYVT